MSGNAVDIELTGGRAEVVLNRPEKLNAVNEQLTQELNAALERVQGDDAVEAIVLTGRGRGFCSGADTDEMQIRSHTRETYRKHLWTIQNTLKLLHDGPKPTIAAVNGPALGAGFSFAMAADFRVMSEDASFNDQHTNIGLVPGGGTPYLLSELIGESRAKEIVLTGRTVDAAEADDLGLVADLVPEGQALEAARELAEHLQGKSSQALQNTKALFGHTDSFEDQLDVAFDYQWECLDTEDHEAALAGGDEA